VRTMVLLMARHKKHEPEQHAQAEALLASGAFPNILYRADVTSPTVNPAILCCLHASIKGRSNNLAFLPTPCRDISLVHAVTSQPGNVGASDTCVHTHVQDIGELVWLSDAPSPYLAEVFWEGNIPSSRLPHVDRDEVKGKHVARVLGSTPLEVKVLGRKVTTILYTILCATTLYCSLELHVLVHLAIWMHEC
jgi:hypothetical protein